METARMVGSRTATALAGLMLSLLVSVAAWYLFDFPFLLFAVPFVPFLFRGRRERPTTRVCPTCGFRTADPAVAYCPRDGTELTDEGA
jgi:hypothetical protein